MAYTLAVLLEKADFPRQGGHGMRDVCRYVGRISLSNNLYTLNIAVKTVFIRF